MPVHLARSWFDGPTAIAGVVALALTAPYWLGPFLIWRKMTQSASKKREAVWLHEMPPEVYEAFNAATPQLVACGFRALAHVRTRNPSNAVQDSFISVWVNEAAGDSAQVIAVRARRPDGSFRCDALVTFRREFPDGSRVLTSNSASPKVFPADPAVDAITCRSCWDLRRLYAVHEPRAARAAAGRLGVLPSEDRVLDDLDAEKRREMRRVIDAGYYSFDPVADAYRPTLKGAFIMTYRMLFPLKQLRYAARDRAADRELRSLGFGGLDALRTGQHSPPATKDAPPLERTPPTASA